MACKRKDEKALNCIAHGFTGKARLNADFYVQVELQKVTSLSKTQEDILLKS